MKDLMFLLFLLLALNACSMGKSEQGKEPSAKSTHNAPQSLQALPVSAFKVQPHKTISVELIYPAKTKSFSQVTVAARVSGILQKMYFKEGGYVNSGYLLFLIEPDIYEAAYESAKAELEKNKAEFNKAERDWKRISAAFHERLVSEQEKDSSLSAYETAKANLKNAEARLKNAEINLGYIKITSPVNAIAGAKMVDIGNLVNPGTPLVTLTQTDPIYVEFAIPDRDILRLGYEITKKSVSLLKGLKASLSLEEGNSYKHSGQIDFIDTVIDEKTSSVKVRGVFPNPDKELLPNQFVRVTLKGLTRKKALIAPQRAVMESPTGTIVWIVENDRAKVRPVKIGETTGEFFVIEEGLQPEELVIMDNLMKLRPDMPVKIDKVS